MMIGIPECDFDREHPVHFQMGRRCSQVFVAYLILSAARLQSEESLYLRTFWRPSHSAAVAGNKLVVPGVQGHPHGTPVAVIDQGNQLGIIFYVRICPSYART